MCLWGICVLPLICFPNLIEGYLEAKWFAFYVLGIFAAISLSLMDGEVLIPRWSSLGKPTQWLLRVALASYILSLSYNHHSLNTLLLLRALTVITISVWFWQLFERGAWAKQFIKYSWLAGWVGILLEDFVKLQKPLSYFPLGIFDNLNLASEYYGFFTVISILYLQTRPSKFLKLILWIGILDALILVVLNKSRGVLLAILISTFCCYLWSLKSKSSRLKLWLALTIGLVILVPSFGIKKIPNFDVLNLGSSEQKSFSSNLRLVRWHNTLAMIAENPLGVGFQEFGFNYLNYRRKFEVDTEIDEHVIAFSPHNTFLDMSAEYGPLFSLASLVLWGLLLLKVRRRMNSESAYFIENQTALTLLVYLGVLAIFAFPLELAWSFALFLFSSQWLFFRLAEWEKLIAKKTIRAAFATTAVVLVILTGVFAGVKIIAQKNPNEEVYNRWGCTLFPSTWSVCLHWSQNFFNEHRWSEAEVVLQNILYRLPENIVVEKQLITVEFQKQKLTEACRLTRKFDSYYGSYHSLRQFEDQNCK